MAAKRVKNVIRSTPYDEALKLEASRSSDPLQVFNKLKTAADLGDDRATYALATWYLHGKNVDRDVEKAISLLIQSAEAGNADALYDLAYSYETGVGVPLNERRALLLYIEAALVGDNQAVYEVARCYWYGVGTVPDKEMSDVWRRRSEALGITG